MQSGAGKPCEHVHMKSLIIDPTFSYETCIEQLM